MFHLCQIIIIVNNTDKRIGGIVYCFVVGRIVPKQVARFVFWGVMLSGGTKKNMFVFKISNDKKITSVY